MHKYNSNDINAIFIQPFLYINDFLNGSTFHHQKQKLICQALERGHQCQSQCNKKEHLGMGMIILLHLQHSLLFVLVPVVLPGGQVLHTGAAVSLAAAVW